MTHFSLLVNNKPFYATNESQLRRKVRDLNTTPFISRETPLNIKALSSKSDLYHTGLISELCSKGMKEKFWTKEEIQKLSALHQVLESGKTEVAQIGEVRDFVGFGELEDDEDGMLNLDDLGLNKNEVHSIAGQKHNSKNAGNGDTESDLEILKQQFSDNSLGIEIETLNLEEDEDLLAELAKSDAVEEEVYQSEEEEIDVSDIEPLTMKVNLVENRCNVELEISPAQILPRHGLKEKIGWGAIDESLVSCLLNKTNLICKYKQEVSFLF